LRNAAIPDQREQRRRSGGYTIVELVITMAVMMILVAIGISFVKSSSGDRKERASIDALTSLITSATSQAQSTNTNMVLQVRNNQALVMGCPGSCLGSLTPVSTLDPVDLTNLSELNTNLVGKTLLGFRSDGIVATSSSNLPGIFPGIAWSSSNVVKGKSQSYRIEVTRYGDALVCDAAAYSSTCPTKVIR